MRKLTYKTDPPLNTLKYNLLACLIVVFIIISACSGEHKSTLRILETTDVHGTILPVDFIDNEKLEASLASVASYVKREREKKDDIILLDNGDILQGQPAVYYYNFIDTITPHLVAEALNYLKYDAVTIGNHDIEAGHPVYDRLRKDYSFPVMGANAINIKTGNPYFEPYCILEKNGIRVAVLGLVTPAVPDWLPPQLYSGIEFTDMLKTAEKWMPEMKKENPDLIIGLFHSGWEKSKLKAAGGGMSEENGSASVAYNVPGFDIIFTGHDHNLSNEKIVNIKGDSVLILNGGSRSEKIAQAEIIFTSGKKQKKITGSLINVRNYKPDPAFVQKFANYSKEISKYVTRIIGRSEKTISSRESYFGPSAFVDMIHEAQLELSGADISFAAPLSFDVQITEGPVTVGDMFKLYRFENMLYTMEMSGSEIKKYLEFSSSLWFSTMKGPGDLLLKYRNGTNGKPQLTNGRPFLLNQPYNFDSASGIEYIVDVSKPEGKRISISSMSDGSPFYEKKMYKVAVNSHRGNGGGGHLTSGAGIRKNELRKRLITSTDKDLRYFIMKSTESKNVINPAPVNNWKLIPLSWVREASDREYRQLFGKNK
jgi:2',3'-cyclic-nucleotide 2'-phosphodiesterase/3'-nucleotidase